MKKLLACVPVSAAPDGVLSGYSIYEKVNCPLCEQEMWLGLRGKALVEKGEVEMVCGLCLALIAQEKNLPADDLAIKKLTDFDH